MTDITKLAYEKITDRYYKARYLGLECIMDTTNGYINATNLCLSTKDKSKRIVKYIDGLRCKILINYYMSNITQYSDDLSIHVVDGLKKIRGTYLHPILFLDLAIWVSPSAYMKANRIITDSLLKDIDKETCVDKDKDICVDKDKDICVDKDKDICVDKDKETCVDTKLSNLEKTLEEALKKREETIIKIITQNITQNEKIQNAFVKSIENIENDSSKIKLSLKRLETKIEPKIEANIEAKIEAKIEPKSSEKKNLFWKKRWFLLECIN
jgi:hypothetical protein